MSNSNAETVRALAVSRRWTPDDAQPLEGAQNRTSWTLQTEPFGEVRVIVWTGEVSGSAHNLCMIIAVAEAALAAEELQATFDLPATSPHLEDEGRQEVRYWFFERNHQTHYLEVRQALSGQVAGSASIALGVPVS
jgi:hypothetical protein